MIDRRVAERVRAALGEVPAVVLLGPRQVGKTTLARDIVDAPPEAVYLDLERVADRARVEDVRGFVERHGGLIVLDEVQHMPGLFAELRGVIDDLRRDGAATGKFLLLGSASNEVLRQSSESLAGRVRYLELGGVTVDEVDDDRATRDALWVRGGFPDSLLAPDDRTSASWRRDFIRTYLERDIPALGPRIPAATLQRFWTMLAHLQGAPFNAAALGRSLDTSGPTVSRYLDLLADLLLVRRVAPWASNVGKRLVKQPRAYVRDSGIVHQLLGIDGLDALLSHPVAGASWEGFVVEQLHAALPLDATAWFYRTAAGAELDLVIDLPGVERWGIEVKLTASPAVSRGFHVACDDIEATHRIIIHGGDDSFTVRGDIEALSLRDAMARLRAIA
ncbi:MAG: ATPase [Thermoleophilia bacterium]|nr:ATPase [Thermoleophilia bacterium]